MRHSRLWIWVALVWLLSVTTATASWRDDIEGVQKGQQDLAQRVERMETLLQNQGMLELVQQLERLQTELRELRGDVEQQTHELEGLRQRQRELYLDIDRRLNDMQLQLGDRSSPQAGANQGQPDSASTATVDSGQGAGGGEDQERAEYMSAFEILRDARYTQAIEAFTAFLQKYPNGKYANNAQYWLGEAYYASRDLKKALVEFQKVLDQYPWSSKLPDAKLKIGYTHYELEQWAQARDVLTGVVTTYPGSSFALLAEKRLNRMKQEGY